MDMHNHTLWRVIIQLAEKGKVTSSEQGIMLNLKFILPM